MTDIIVVGGGASGLMAAVTAAAAGDKVAVLEQNDRVGRKLLATGNGRCNYTNQYQDRSCYHSENAAFPWGILGQFDAERTVDFFQELGIYPKSRNGYLYPNSDQASAILDVLVMECSRLHVEFYREQKCTQILPQKSGFLIKTNAGELRARRVILAAGSKASAIPGSDGSGYALAKGLGHPLTPILPALVQLRCTEDCYFFGGDRTFTGVFLGCGYRDRCRFLQTMPVLQRTRERYSLQLTAFRAFRYSRSALRRRKLCTPGKR